MPRTSTSWRKGQSGNPNGRPRRDWSISEYARLYLLEDEVVQGDGGGESQAVPRLELFVDAIFRTAVSGSAAAQRLILQYVDGLPLQKLEINGAHEEQLQELFASPEVTELTTLLQEAVDRLPDLRERYENLIGLKGELETKSQEVVFPTDG